MLIKKKPSIQQRFSNNSITRIVTRDAQDFFTGTRAQVESNLAGERVDDVDVSRRHVSGRVFVVDDFGARQIPLDTTMDMIIKRESSGGPRTRGTVLTGS